MKVVSCHNLYIHDKLLILHCSPSGSLQSWPNSQIWWFIKSDTVISNDTVQCSGWNKSCQKLRYEQLWTLWSTRTATVAVLVAASWSSILIYLSVLYENLCNSFWIVCFYLFDIRSNWRTNCWGVVMCRYVWTTLVSYWRFPFT